MRVSIGACHSSSSSVMTAAFCEGERSNSWKAFCSDNAVSAQIALRRSGRLIVISVVPSALFSTRTFCMGTPLFLPRRFRTLWLRFRGSYVAAPV